MKIKSHIRSVQLIFSIFIFLIFAGLTGCKDDGAEFLEKELVQEESTETSGVDLEQEDPTDAESGVSEKKSEEKQVDTVQETAAAKQQPEIAMALLRFFVVFFSPLITHSPPSRNFPVPSDSHTDDGNHCPKPSTLHVFHAL